MNNEKVSIQELVDLIAQQAGTSKKKADDFLKVFQTTIEEGLIKDGAVKIKGLGTFKLIWNEARKSVNVQTGEEYTIPGHNKATFLPEAGVKELINKPYAHLDSVSLDGEVAPKSEINPLDKFNEQAEEIKNIISELNMPKASVELVPEEVEQPMEVVGAKTEPIIDKVVEPIKETVIPAKADDKAVVVSHNNQHESIQHAALSEKHTLKRDIPIKPKRKVRIIVPLIIIGVILGLGGLYFQYKDTLIPIYTAKLKAAISIAKTEDKPMPILKAKVKTEKQHVVPNNTIRSNKVDTVKQVTAKPTVVAKAVVNTPKTSVFDEERVYKTFIATEVIEKGSRLTLLAEKHYGHKDFWVYIYEANKVNIKNPGNVPVGMSIKIPKLNPALIDLNNPECLKYAKTLHDKYVSK